ncbi:MAG: MFS transporter [Ideonella sp.]|nr:MFS transporter [Ideonella sp.]
MAVAVAKTPMSTEERKVIFASSLGTVFEWYDFYLYGTLAVIIGNQFFSALDPASRTIFALLAFAAGFIVRPFGALVFGRLGDMIGRKYTFLVTLLIMGLSTFIVGVLPNYAAVGVAAPIILIGLRLLQGLALGGEYGGAAIFVAEHAPQGRRGAYTAWIQTTATLGLLLSLLVILGVRKLLGESDFEEWGWRLPFLASFLLLAISIWIRLAMNESPAFQRMKEEGKTSQAPLAESFARWKNLKRVILALLGLTAGQAVVWYTGQFYALFFLTDALKVATDTAYLLTAASLVIGTPFFIVFGSLSDRVGRKPIIMAGCLLAALTYFPLFQALTAAANPALAAAQSANSVVVVSDPAACSFQFNPAETAQFTSSCDIAKKQLSSRSVSYAHEDAPPGVAAVIRVGQTQIVSYDRETISAADMAAFEQAAADTLHALRAIPDTSRTALNHAEEALASFGRDARTATLKAKEAKMAAELNAALREAGYPEQADPAQIDKPRVILILSILVLYVTMVYGPIAAILVEMFPTRIRYTSLSLPYHIGNGWFGGLLPATALAIVAQTGNMYSGLWYPILIAGLSCVIGTLWLRDTKDVDIHSSI